MNTTSIHARRLKNYLRQGRVKVNGITADIGDNTSVGDASLDDVLIPLKGLFRKFAREALRGNKTSRFRSHKKEE